MLLKKISRGKKLNQVKIAFKSYSRNIRNDYFIFKGSVSSLLEPDATLTDDDDFAKVVIFKPL